MVLCEYVTAAQKLIGALYGDITVIKGLTKRQAVGETWVAVGGGAGQQPLAVKQAPCVTGLPWLGSSEARHDRALVVGTVVWDVLRAATDVVVVVWFGMKWSCSTPACTSRRSPAGAHWRRSWRSSSPCNRSCTSNCRPLARLRSGWRRRRWFPMMAPALEPPLWAQGSSRVAGERAAEMLEDSGSGQEAAMEE